MSWISKLTAMFRTAHVDQEIAAEQEFHIASRVEEYIAAGASPAEATAQARREFGNRGRTAAESRDAKLFVWLESAIQDIYYGFRTLMKSRAFALTAILTLGLGIGVNTAVFSVVNGVLLNPLPYRDANHIVVLFDKIPNFENGSISYPNFLDWQRMNRSFSLLAAYRGASFNLAGRSKPEHLQGEMISAGFFEILGVKPVIGRTFSLPEDRRGANPTAMISESLWRREFGSASNIIGQLLRVDGVDRTVVGVVPANFRLHIQNFERDTPLNDIYTPIGESNPPSFYEDRGSPWGMDAIGRLKPGVTLPLAREDMLRVSRELTAMYPEVNGNQRANLVSLKEEMVGGVRSVLLVLLSAVMAVLLIACVNVANLQLARSTSRQREFAIRIAVGAGQGRIIRQLLTESLLLALLGGAVGFVLAKLGTAAAIAAVPQRLPQAEEIGLDFRVLLFTTAISLMAGLLFGLTPALQMRRGNTGVTLRESGRSVASARTHTLSTFVVVEMALALVLLVSAGLMVRTLFVLWGVDPGFNPHGVMTFQVSPQPSLRHEEPAAIRAFFRQMHDRLASAPGIEALSLSWAASPMGGDRESYFWIVGRSKPTNVTDLPMEVTYVVEPDYLKTMRLSLVRGRFLTNQDDNKSPAVVVIDETLAKKYFPGENPVGRFLDYNNDPLARERVPNPQVVGVVRHINQWGLDADASNPLHAEVFLPIAQVQDKDLKDLAQRLVVYARGANGTPPSSTVLRNRLTQLNKNLVAFDAEPMEKVVLKSIASERFTMALLAVFAALALLLASIGIYGVLSYLVGQRRQEIGLRMALGASRPDVLCLILKDGARMTAFGIAIGVIAALALTRLMASMLFGVQPTDLLTFVIVIGVLFLVALLACTVPARRAMRLDPMIALREE